MILIPLVSSATEDPIGDLIKGQPKQTTEKKLVIVIDPGHGGKDTGAIGVKKVREKDIVLSISKELKKALHRLLPAEVILTRSDDRFLSLENRNQVAIRHKADLFISVHANAARRKAAAGIEVYYLNNASDKAAAKLAARENRYSPKKLSDYDAILSSMLQNESTILSRYLAHDVLHAIKAKMYKKYSLQRLEVKTALFYVLVGSKTPSLLLETGFVSNPKEARRLQQKEYQRLLAKTVAQGVVRYLEKLKTRQITL